MSQCAILAIVPLKEHFDSVITRFQRHARDVIPIPEKRCIIALDLPYKTARTFARNSNWIRIFNPEETTPQDLVKIRKALRHDTLNAHKPTPAAA